MTLPSKPSLFDPIKIGDLELPNRILMNPLTRQRASAGRVPNELMAEYYRQRASAGLILSEGTAVTPMGVGYVDTPGLWSAEQVQGWKLVTAAVHGAGGRIFAQLWHVGRVSAPMFLDGALPVAPSAVRPAGFVDLVRPKQEYVTPRALAREELPGIVEAYRVAAVNALQAGFDGVHIHAANGYLLDNFLQDKTNRRTDDYGGSVAGRAKLLLEVTEAAISVWGAGRVGVHLAPRGDAEDMGDSDKFHTFTETARLLNERNIAFISVREYAAADSVAPRMRAVFGGTFIANEDLTRESAQALLDSGQADAVSFGRAYISNPDLVHRLRIGAPLAPSQQQTWYTPGPAGYIDYPPLSAS